VADAPGGGAHMEVVWRRVYPREIQPEREPRPQAEDQRAEDQRAEQQQAEPRRAGSEEVPLLPASRPESDVPTVLAPGGPGAQ
jgi:hypothetical protein